MHSETSKLARRAFKDAFENPGMAFEGLFQFISTRFKKLSGKDTLFAVFSDGAFIADLILSVRLLTPFNEQVREFDVLRLKFSCAKLLDSLQLVVEDFEVHSRGKTHLLGSPVPLEVEAPLAPEPNKYSLLAGANAIDAHKSPFYPDASSSRLAFEAPHVALPSQGQLFGHYFAPEGPGAKPLEPQQLGLFKQSALLPQNYGVPFSGLYYVPEPPLNSQQAYRSVNAPLPGAVSFLPESGRGLPLLGKRPPGSEFHHISDLMAGDRGWQLRVKVVSKHDMKKFRNEQGLYFSTIVQDLSGKIRATFFNNAARAAFEKVREGGSYLLSGGEVEKATRYNTTDHRYEIVFKDSLKITELSDAPEACEQERFAEYMTISDILRKNQNEVVNIVAFVREEGELIMKDLRRGGQKELKQPVVVDRNGEIIEVCLWGEFAREVRIQQGRAYAIRNIKVKRFGEQTYLVWENYTKVIAEVSNEPWIGWALPQADAHDFCQVLGAPSFILGNQPLAGASQLTLPGPAFERPPLCAPTAGQNPRLCQRGPQEEPHGQSAGIPSVPRFVPEVTEVSREQSLAAQERPFLSIAEVNQKCDEFFSDPFNKYQKLVLEFYGYINHMSKNVWYDSCGLKNCKKKVTELENRKRYCGKCKMSVASPLTRFMADVKVIDGNDRIFGRIFGEDNCVNIFGKTINEIKQIKSIDEEEFYRVLKDVEYCEFFFRILVRKSEYQGENRIAVEFLSVQKIEPLAESLSQRVVEILEFSE